MIHWLFIGNKPMVHWCCIGDKPMVQWWCIGDKSMVHPWYIYGKIHDTGNTQIIGDVQVINRWKVGIA